MDGLIFAIWVGIGMALLKGVLWRFGRYPEL